MGLDQDKDDRDEEAELWDHVDDIDDHLLAEYMRD